MEGSETWRCLSFVIHRRQSSCFAKGNSKFFLRGVYKTTTQKKRHGSNFFRIHTETYQNHPSDPRWYVQIHTRGVQRRSQKRAGGDTPKAGRDESKVCTTATHYSTAPAVATTTPELQKLQASLASMEKRATDAEAKTTRLEQSTQQLKASLASAETDRTEAEKRLNESVQKLASAEAARKKAEQRATDVEAGTTSKLKVFEADIMSMLDGISPRRMAAGGTFQEETILSVLGSTADHKESARVALEAMRETLRSVGKHEDLVKQWDETLATLENPKTTVVDHTTETPNAHYYEDIPTVVGLVPVVRRLLDRYTSARERRDTTEATLARAEFEASMLEATGIQYALDPMVWETKQ